jgi:hypothetical protein
MNDTISDTSTGGMKAAAAQEPIMQFFAFEHLKPDLQIVSSQFYFTAIYLLEQLPRNPERTVALRKLLEAKDAAVRAKLYQEQKP